MDESALTALLNNELRNAMGYVGRLTQERERALFYYRGEAKGDLSAPEVEGRSSVVSTDLMDTVEWIMPQLMRIFMSGEDVVEFSPKKAEAEESAKLITQYVNYIMQHDNEGFRVLHTCIKDALIEKMGVAKVYWTTEGVERKEEYQGLTQEALAEVMKDEDVELRQATERIDPMTGMPVYDAVFCRKTEEGRVKIDPVPPEEFLFARDSKSTQHSRFMAHRVQKTISDLRQAGYDEKKLENLGSDEGAIDLTGERVQRALQDDENAWANRYREASQDPASRIVWVNECYIKVDYDGDGIVEWRKVVKAGNVVLENEEIDEPPFVVFTPLLMSHRMIGLGMYDLVGDLQRIKTALLRQVLDNAYLINNGRYLALNDRVNLDDLLTVRPGGIVRVDQMDAVQPLPVNPIGNNALPLLEYVDELRQNRTGVTAHTQGIDGDALNKTATGMQILQDASQARIELIARTMAETAVKQLFRLVFMLVCKHQKTSRMMRVNGKYIPVNPREWVNEYDMTINVGLGMGNKQGQQQSLMQLLTIQKDALAAQLIPPNKVLATARRLTEAMGYKNVDQFWPTDQEAQQMMQQQQQKPPQDPILIQQQIDAHKQQTAQAIETFKAQQQSQLQQQKAQLDQAAEAARLQQEKQLAMLEIEKKAAVTMRVEAMKAAVEIVKSASLGQIQDVQQQAAEVARLTEEIDATANKLAQ